MENKNEIYHIQISDNSKIRNTIINIGKDLEKDIKSNKVEEEDLYQFFFVKDLYNEKCTKIKDKEKFTKFINFANAFIKERNDFIFLYFKKININLIKIILNGYIEAEIKEPEQKIFLLGTIKTIFDLYFSKNLFTLVYNKLSKIFRQFNCLENKEILFDKFNKLFDVWNLLFDINLKPKNELNYIAFIGNQVLTLINNENKVNNIDILIEFVDGINYLNNKDISFINVEYFGNEKQNVKFEGILNEKDMKSINNIFIRIDLKSILYLNNLEGEFNESKLNESKTFINFDKDKNFLKIEILKNYIGKINRIKLSINSNNENLENKTYEIIPSDNQKGYKIIPLEEDKEYLKIYFDNKPICSKIYKELLYDDLRYYGGLECFIPLIKIIKFFFPTFEKNQDKIDLLNKMLINIIQNIIKLILYSEKNYENFKKILSSLLGALAEINHSYPYNLKNNFYSHSSFSLLYILILNSSIPLTLKEAYIKITGLNSNDKLNLNFEDLIINLDKLNITSYNWYITNIITIIEFILFEYDDINIIPKKIKEQLSILIQENKINKDIEIMKYIYFSNKISNYLFSNQNEENNISLEEIFKNFFIQNYNEQNLILILRMMKVFCNLIIFDLSRSEISFENIGIKELINDKMPKEKNNFKRKLVNFFYDFEKIFEEKAQSIERLYPIVFKDYKAYNDYFIKIFPFLKNNKCFIFESELFLEEFIDFHRDYHKLMKNNFIYNRFWSDKKLFFNEKKRNKYLKYKSINYYTKNYMKPFVFPDLDYKSSYPNFKMFNIDKNFYKEEENPDEYNFSLDCPELNSFIFELEEKYFEKIKNRLGLVIHEVCLIKKTHHIKGKLIIYTGKNNLLKKIMFISYPRYLVESKQCCNVFPNNKKFKEKKICYGSIFACPNKDMDIKIIIDIKDIRMILKRIYYYTKSAVEIFTMNKSYYFNFAGNNPKDLNENCKNFVNLFAYYIYEFFPIKIRKQEIGYSRQFQEILIEYRNKEDNYDTDIGNKFISSLFEYWQSNTKGKDFSTLDLLIYLNLLSNRSYNDLFQYPVFPTLFFYDKTKDDKFNLVERKLNKHIGFQEVSNKAKERKKALKDLYKESLKELDEEDNKNDNKKNVSYFSTHYSTNFYVSNFLIRLFPDTFIAIELQGDGFDHPNRLFYSIEETFYNISFQRSDVRELIPEFYYFPEIFLNLNNLNFGIRANGEAIDEVIMPKDLNKISKENNNSNNIINVSENSEYFNSFKLVEKMRNFLESRKAADIISWINIIFGPEQKYKKLGRKDLLFKNESYIDFSDKKEKDFQIYREDDNFMVSVEFGISPVQIVLEGDTSKAKKRNNIYDLKFKDEKTLLKEICKSYADTIKKQIVSIKTEEKNKTENINNEKIKNEKFVNIYNSINIYKISTTNKNNELKENESNNNNINNIFLNPELFINCVFTKDNIKIIGYKTGKIEVLIKKTKEEKEDDDFDMVSEFFDHDDEIVHIYYNQRLNTFCTTSKDGLLNLYIFPNKLINTIKNPNEGNFFSKAFLCSNPFPAIIAIDENSFEIFSYSINGFKIKRMKLDYLLELKEIKNDLYIAINFNEYGGSQKDRMIFLEHLKNKEKDGSFKCHLIRVPLLEKEEKEIDVK